MTVTPLPGERDEQSPTSSTAKAASVETDKPVTIKQFLLDVVVREQEGYVCIGYANKAQGKPYQQEFFLWPQETAQTMQFIKKKTEEGADLWYCTQLLSCKSREKVDVKSVSSLWADFDEELPTAFLVEPSIVIQSSPGKSHVYWLLEEPVSPQEAEAANKRITYYEGADKGGWALSKLLRIPGTSNYKNTWDQKWQDQGYVEPYYITVKSHKPTRYSLSDFDGYPEAESRSTEVVATPMPSLSELEALGSAEQILFRYRTIPAYGEITDLRLNASDDRSKVLFKLIRLCTEAGMTAPEVFVVCTNTANDKWSLPPYNNPKLLWADIERTNKRAEQVKLGPKAFFDKASPQYRKMAEYIVTHVPLALSDTGDVYAYKDGVYTRSRDAIGDALVDLLQDKYKASHKSSVTDIVVKMLKDKDQRIDLTVPGKIVVANGVLDLRTLELSPFTPLLYTTAKLPVEWDPKASCDKFLSWAQSVGITEYLPILEEYIASALDPSSDKHHSIMLVGPSHSGKSTFIRFMQAIIGRNNATSISLHELCENKFATAELYGKLLNTCGDISGKDIKDISKFLALVGGDTTRAEKKYQDSFELKNTTLMVFSTNSPPAMASAHAHAYLNRMKAFPFSKTFEGHENPHVEKLILSTELPGILCRLVEAYRRTQRHGRLPEVPKEFMEEFAGQSDRVRQWINENCERLTDFRSNMPRPENGTSGQVLFYAFNEWAADNKFGEMGKTLFYAALESNGVRPFSPNRQPSTKWFRIHFKPTETEREYEGNVVTVFPNGRERKS